MTKLDIADQIENGNDLLSLPQALSELLSEMDKEDFSADKLATIVLKDPSLTARILKLANSSYYNRFAEISTVHSAVQILGVTTVKCLALSTSVFHPEKIENQTGIVAKDYFARILTVAAAAEKIAEKVTYKAPEEAFIAGLLHDIGTMFFLHHYPLEYRKILQKKLSPYKVAEMERDLFGVDHFETGFLLATRWRLPENIIKAIELQNREVAKDDSTLSNVLKLASLLVVNDLADGEEIESKLNRIAKVSEALSLPREDVDSISAALLSWTVSVAEYLGVDIGNIEEMLTQANQEIWRTYLMVENLFKQRQELSQKVLDEERHRGAAESKNIAMATLSHYLNNAAMAIYGRSQLMRIKAKKGEVDGFMDYLPKNLDVIDHSIKKIVAVLAEIKDISPIDEIKFLDTSSAMNLDDRIALRMKKMESESGLEMPDEVLEATKG